MNFYYFETSYQLSHMRASIPPVSSHSSLFPVRWEEEASLGVIIPGGELTKVGHGYSPAPPLPPGDPWMCAPAGSPTGRRSFSRSALLFFSASRHISLSVSLNAVLLLWPLAVFFFLVCRDDFSAGCKLFWPRIRRFAYSA